MYESGNTNKRPYNIIVIPDQKEERSQTAYFNYTIKFV